MSSPARRAATWEDLQQTPDDGRIYEVIDGDLGAMPRPSAAHTTVHSSLGMEIGPPFQKGRGGPGGWWILFEPEVRLGLHDIVVPDLGGWRRERLQALPPNGPFDVRPDWMCEVLSPRQHRRDRVVKRALYERYGVPHYWIVDPVERLVEVLELREGTYLTLGIWDGTQRARLPPFDAIELDLAEFFPPGVEIP